MFKDGTSAAGRKLGSRFAQAIFAGHPDAGMAAETPRLESPPCRRKQGSLAVPA